MFQGFSPDTFDFLWGIRFNNNREWFAEHKPDYQNHLYFPMKELVKEMEPVVEGEDGMKLQLSRIYRDMRMHPETFYKDSLWFTLRHRDDYWLENPCLCFELRPEGYRYGFLMARPRMDVCRKSDTSRSNRVIMSNLISQTVLPSREFASAFSQGRWSARIP